MPISDQSQEDRISFTHQEALDFHQRGKPGKLEITPTKPMATQRDLSLAYSPGVAIPVQAIADDPQCAYDYTTRGNMVAVISNGTAILGLGNLGALASKPVMEGKSVLFKRFADIDSIDLEVDTENVEEFINAVRYLGPSFGGINLEDIKSPDCFIIEQKLRELMDIPVFHDDQHGTAIIAAAGIINALDITGKNIKDIRVVMNGAGAAGISTLNLIKALGLPHENALMLDSAGVLYEGREKKINQWQSAHVVKSDEVRTLEEAMKGADVFLGLSVKDVVTPEMVASMAPKPIIFAMANPDPEIKPELIKSVRSDAIIATGRSDYPNQVNNVLGFPYIFRGALDVGASTINEEMKLAAAKAIAQLAREDVPDDVAEAYRGARPRFGPNYIIPVPFDPRLISAIPPAVARAAMETGVARRPIIDEEDYVHKLSARRDPMAASLQRVFQRLRRHPRRVIFAEGEEEQVIRAARAFKMSGYGIPVLIGREDAIFETAKEAGIEISSDFEIVNARNSNKIETYTDFLYKRLQRQGYLYRDCLRLVHTDRNVFSALMVAHNDADALVSGVTRNYGTVLDDMRRVFDVQKGRHLCGVSLALCQRRTVIVADTAVTDMPNAEQLANIAIEAAGVARRLGHEPRVAMLAYSTFGYPIGERSERVKEAVQILDRRGVDFEYDGEMSAEVALNPEKMAAYPFCRLSEPANVLVMPAFHSASISTQMIKELGGATMIGPMLVGFEKPVQIVSLGAKDTDIVNMAALAAYDLNR